MSAPQHDDDSVPSRDERLLAALRHAPDHDAAPPPAVAAAIAAAARAAVTQSPVAAAAAAAQQAEAAVVDAARPARPLPATPPQPRLSWSPRAANAWREWLDTLSSPRPVWAGGAAALLVSVLTLSMWIDEPIPPAVVSDAPPVVTLPRLPNDLLAGPGHLPAAAPSQGQAERELPAPTAKSARDAAVSPPEGRAPATPAPQRAAPAPAPGRAPVPAPAPTAGPTLPAQSPAERAERSDLADLARQRQDRLAERTAELAAKSTAPARSAAPPAEPAAETRARQQPPVSPVPESFPAAPTPPATQGGLATAPSTAAPAAALPRPGAPLAPSGATTALPPPAAAIARPPSPARQATAEAGARDHNEAAAAMPRPAAPAPAAAPRAFAGPAARGDAAAGRASGPGPEPGPEATRSSPPSLPSLLVAPGLDPMQQRLLQRIDEFGRGRWQRLPAVGAAAEPAAAPLRAWLLQPAASARVRLRLDADGLRWTEADGASWFIPLDAATVEALQTLR